MKFSYKTDRLILRIIEPNSADAAKIMDFQYRNDELFSRYEPVHSENFFTLDHQIKLLDAEYNAALRMSMIRFWLFLRDDPSDVIGTVSFREITLHFARCCKIGYKLDQDYFHQGLMTEAVKKGTEIMFEEAELHRIIATIMPENTPSIRLAKRIGFSYEGTERKAYLVNNRWEDHERWTLLNPADDED